MATANNSAVTSAVLDTWITNIYGSVRSSPSPADCLCSALGYAALQLKKATNPPTVFLLQMFV